MPLSVLKSAFVTPDHQGQALREGECQQLDQSELGPELPVLCADPALAEGRREQLTVFDSTGFALEDHIASTCSSNSPRRPVSATGCSWNTCRRTRSTRTPSSDGTGLCPPGQGAADSPVASRTPRGSRRRGEHVVEHLGSRALARRAPQDSRYRRTARIRRL
ncbi:hypothetical protein GCM10017744_009250 [Streptomyces antimycoticus]